MNAKVLHFTVYGAANGRPGKLKLMSIARARRADHADPWPIVAVLCQFWQGPAFLLVGAFVL